MSQCFDRIHVRSLDRGVEAKADAYEAAEDEAADDAPRGDVGGIGLAAEVADDRRQQGGQSSAQGDANGAATEGNNRCFNEELKRDVLSLGSQRSADADLARALGH